MDPVLNLVAGGVTFLAWVRMSVNSSNEGECWNRDWRSAVTLSRFGTRRSVRTTAVCPMDEEVRMMPLEVLVSAMENIVTEHHERPGQVSVVIVSVFGTFQSFTQVTLREF